MASNPFIFSINKYRHKNLCDLSANDSFSIIERIVLPEHNTNSSIWIMLRKYYQLCLGSKKKAKFFISDQCQLSWIIFKILFTCLFKTLIPVTCWTKCTSVCSEIINSNLIVPNKVAVTNRNSIRSISWGDSYCWFCAHRWPMRCQLPIRNLEILHSSHFCLQSLHTHCSHNN